MASNKAENYLRMHHPSIYKGMKKGGKVKKYKDGGYVEEAENASSQGDVVPAMLTPKEVVLNADQLGKLQDVTGMKVEALFNQIGVPGFEGGGMIEYLPNMARKMHKKQENYKHGGKVSKNDALMAYYMGGKVKKKKRGY